MPVISDAAIASYAKGAGLNATNAAIAVAVAIAESGGDTNAHNATPPDDSYGLWQINMLGSMGPARRTQFGLSKNEQLYDPATNAKAMAAISNGGKSWSPWTTYTRGTYRTYMARGMAAASSSASDGTIVTTPVDSGTSSNAITAFFDRIQDPKFWTIIGFLAAGAFLVFIGVMKMTGDGQLSGTTKGVLEGAVGLLPGGGTVIKGAKAVGGAVR